MEALEAVLTLRDVAEFEDKPVPKEIKLKILEAARSSQTGLNLQHWRFILVQEKENLKKLAEDSTTGKWIENANFAIIVLTDPKYRFHVLDAGRVIQNMKIAAWNYGVISRVYTGFDEEAMRRDFKIPNNLQPSAVLGFGYPKRRITGKRKNRKPLEELVFIEYYGNSFSVDKIK